MKKRVGKEFTLERGFGSQDLGRTLRDKSVPIDGASLNRALESGLDEEKRKKLELIRLKEEQIRLREGLPFLHGWKWYKWAREFFDSKNRLNFICAANQISKSSTQIRKCIDWATNQPLWPSLWVRKPVQFWYLYPSQKVVDAEFKTKWQQFLPRNEYKDSGPYAWKELKGDRGTPAGIHFLASNVYVFFKTYTQNTQDLQTGTCDAIFCDEELPVDLYDELIFRVSASDGYFHMVFTATLGQEFWRAVIEGKGQKEKLPTAAKWQVSMYDCLIYEDYTKSHWTEQKIALVKARCKSDAEVLRRVYGRFIMDTGRKYHQFQLVKHVTSAPKMTPEWFIYAGVDSGSGGTSNSPAAICFVAVRPDFRYAEVFRGWRGDDLETTSGDILDKFLELRRGLPPFTGQYYDYADRDFFEIASRAGHPFMAAEKNHSTGEEILNVLFKNNMLYVHEDPELEKLVWELTNLSSETRKKDAYDDFCDALRYAVTRIPWDWSCLTGNTPEWTERAPEPAKSELARQIDERRAMMAEAKKEDGWEIEEEFAEIAGLLGD